MNNIIGTIEDSSMEVVVEIQGSGPKGDPGEKGEKGDPSTVNNIVAVDGNIELTANDIPYDEDTSVQGAIDELRQQTNTLDADIDEHKADDTKHITSTERTIWNNKLDASAYTAADVLAKVKTVDGDGSGLDADLLDGAHAGNGPNNVLKLDSGGFVPLPNIPGTLTGKSADMVDGKHFSDIQNDAQAKVDTHASLKQTHGISSGYYIAKTSRSDQLPAWGDIQGKPSSFTPATHGNEAHNPAFALASDLTSHSNDNIKHITNAERNAWNAKETPSGAQSKVDTHASSKQTHGISSGYYIAKTSRSDQLPDWNDIQGKPDLALAADLAAHEEKAAPHSGHETPEGAQEKANAALNSAKQYTDQEVGEVSQALATHKAAAAPHSGHETPAGAQAKANTAEANAKAYTDAHEQKAAPHSGHETPAGAQAKADTAETNAKNHANSLVGTLSNLLTTAKNNVVAAINEIFGKVEDVEGDLESHKADGASHSKTARFVIGTSTAGWTSKDVDYLCDGTNDQEEIIQALNALPATGGEVVILDGTYNITASINIPKDNVSLRGNGNATILKRMYNSTSDNSGPTAKGLITLNEKSGCKIQGLQIDGNKATYTEYHNYGIYLDSSSDNTVTGNTCNNNYYGIRLYSSSDNNTVTGNTCNNNSYGINLSSSSNNTVTGNTCNNNSYGINLSSSSNNTVTGNTCNNNSYGIRLYSSSNNTVTGNTCNNNNYGIRLASSSNNTVTGNTCNNNSYGIYLYSSSNNNTVTGNTCIRGIGAPEDYTTDQHTIFLYGTSNNYNLISSNNCMGKAVVVEGGTGNSAWGNKFDNTDDLP